MSSMKSCCNKIFGGNKKKVVGDYIGTQWNQSQCKHLFPFNHSFFSSFCPKCIELVANSQCYWKCVDHLLKVVGWINLLWGVKPTFIYEK